MFLQELNTGHRSRVVCHKVLCDTARALGKDWWSELILLQREKISKPLKFLFKGNLWLPNSKLVTTWYSWSLICHLTAAPEITLKSISALWCCWLGSHGGSWDDRPVKGHCLKAVKTFTLHLTTKKTFYFFGTLIRLKFQKFFWLHWPQANHCGQLLACSTRVAIA